MGLFASSLLIYFGWCRYRTRLRLHLEDFTQIVAQITTGPGREHAVGAAQNKGKPVGAGIIFISIFIFVGFLFVPLGTRYLAALGCLFLAMLVGFFDDRYEWSEYRMGLFDLVISILGAMVVCQMAAVEVWLPLIKTSVIVPPWIISLLLHACCG